MPPGGYSILIKNQSFQKIKGFFIMGIFKDISCSIGFLSTIPIVLKSDIDFSSVNMKPYFPIVGLIIGILVATFDRIIGFFFPLYISSWLDVVMLIFLTGGLHLDGLADSADGLFSHRPLNQVLDIMKDSRIGTMGVLALVSVLGIKYLGLTGIHTHRFLLISIIPAYSRTSMVIAMKYLKYCRKDGTAKIFFKEEVTVKDFVLFLPLMCISFLVLKVGILINISFFLISFLIIFFYKKKLGCITGDTLGCMCEIVESFLFLLTAAVC